MTVSTWKWTIDRYHQAVEAGVFDDAPVELLNGELIEMSPEGIPHSSFSDEAAEYLREQLRGLAKVRESKPITLPNNSEPEPDIAIVQLPVEIYRSHHPYVENIYWLIEYSNSSLQKDLEVKFQVYATAGVLEYWVINLKTRELLVFRHPVNGAYRSQQTFTTGTISPLSFPDVQIDVARILRF